MRTAERKRTSQSDAQRQNYPGDIDGLAVHSLSGRPDYSLFGLDLGMAASEQKLPALNLYLFPLNDTRAMPAYSLSGRPDYTLYGLEPDEAAGNEVMLGVKLHPHNYALTERLPVYSLSGPPDYTLYGLK